MLSPMLECLQIDNIDTVDKCRAIAAVLPKLSRLKLFRFSVSVTPRENVSVKPLFLQAFQKNASLEEVLENGHCPHLRADNFRYFDSIDKQRLARYAARNKALPLLIESPCSISVQLWPNIFQSLRGCERWREPDIVFRSLVSLGESVGRHAAK